MRALAVMLVLVFHATAKRWLPGGFIGVDIFFALSGFLITSLLLQERERTGATDFIAFYKRRAFRLWPALIAMLLAYVAMARFVPGADGGRDALLAGLYLSDYSRAFWGMPVGLAHTWSLSVEEHFYLLWPLVIVALTRVRSRAAIAAILFAGFALATAWRIADFAAHHDWMRTYYRFDTRMSGLLLGGCVAALPWRPKLAGISDALAITSLAVLAAGSATMVFASAQAFGWQGFVVDVAASMLVLAMAGTPGFVHRALSWRPAVALGTISYAVYLWHYPIAKALSPDLSPGEATVITAAFSIGAAALSWFLIEKPIRIFRRVPAAA